MEKRKILYQEKQKSISLNHQNTHLETLNFDDITKELTSIISEINKDFLKIKIENNSFQIYGKTIITLTNSQLLQSLRL